MIDFIFEFILELLIEGSFSVISNKRINKGIRYLIFIMISSFFLLIIGIVMLVAFQIIRESVLAFLVLFVIALVMIIGVVKKFKSLYHKIRNND